MQSREEFLGNARQVTCPVMVVVAEQAPAASKAEMEAIADHLEVKSVRLPGSLGLAEEYGADVAAAALPFLAQGQ